MTQYFTEEGECIPVTAIQVGPVTVVQKKTMETDGYSAVQIGFEEIAENKMKNVTKPMKGHFGDQKPVRFLKEVAAENIEHIEIGQKFDIGMFQKGDIVDVSGKSKGRGFTGVVKRYNFRGGCDSHGHRFHRGTGAIGQSATPGKVFKNKKMAGRHGNSRITVQGLKIVNIDSGLNVMLVKGGIPGPNGRLVEVRKTSKG